MYFTLHLFKPETSRCHRRPTCHDLQSIPTDPKIGEGGRGGVSFDRVLLDTALGNELLHGAQVESLQ